MTRIEGLMTNTLPTGTKYNIVSTDYNPSLYQIRKSGESGGVIEALSGLYTSTKQAQKVLTIHLLEVWDRFETSKPKK